MSNLLRQHIDKIIMRIIWKILIWSQL